jgi:tRNA-2-methylthio-N6-dimethylallyladenosine synthase
MEDDVSEEIKARRLQEIVDLNTPGLPEQFIGQIVEVLVEKISKKSTEEFSGRNSQSITSFFQKKIIKLVTL